MENHSETNIVPLRSRQEPQHRLPPHNYEAEQALLAALLANNSRVHPMIVGLVRAEDFADPLHGRIFTAACQLIDRGQSANILTMRSMFDQDPALIDIGGADYLARLENAVVTTRFADDYARVVRDLADRRRFIAACERSIEDAHQVDINRPATQVAAEWVAEVQQGVVGADDGLVSIAEVSEQIVNGLGEDLPRFPTGLQRLDEALAGGLYSGKLYGIAAKYKAGKSLLMATIAYNLTLAGVSTLYLSLEMGPDELVQRMMARSMNVNGLAFLGQGRNSTQFQSEAAQAAIHLGHHNHLVLVQRPRMALEDVLASITRAALRRQVKVAFVDYLQLVSGQRRNESLAVHYDNVAQALAEATKRHGILIVVGAQTNREDGIRQGDGLLNACDLALRLHKVETEDMPDRAWVEMMASRFTPRINVGSKDNPAFELDTGAGPSFREI